MRLIAVLLLIFACVFPASPAGKKHRGNLVKLPPNSAEIADIRIVKPKQPCLNWSWASAAETILARHKVEVDQTELILKTDLGQLCIDRPVDLLKIKKVLDGEYVLHDGSKVTVEVVVNSGPPTDVGNLIWHMRQNQPLLMTWRGRPLVLQAVEYDEYIFPNSQRMFEARKLTFVDPLSDKPVVFDKLVDDTAEIGGTLAILVTPSR